MILLWCPGETHGLTTVTKRRLPRAKWCPGFIPLELSQGIMHSSQKCITLLYVYSVLCTMPVIIWTALNISSFPKNGTLPQFERQMCLSCSGTMHSSASLCCFLEIFELFQYSSESDRVPVNPIIPCISVQYTSHCKK